MRTFDTILTAFWRLFGWILSEFAPFRVTLAIPAA